VQISATVSLGAADAHVLTFPNFINYFVVHNLSISQM